MIKKSCKRSGRSFKSDKIHNDKDMNFKDLDTKFICLKKEMIQEKCISMY